MIIYLEGPDGSGKSTLVESIEDMLLENPDKLTVYAKANILVPTHPKHAYRLDEKTLFKRLTTMAKSTTVYILDRCFISDCVYRVFDDHKAITTVPKIIRFLKKYNQKIFTIYCRTKDAEKAMLERGDENPIALAKHKEITKIFDIIMSMVDENITYNYIRYDFTKKRNINEVLGAVNYFVYMSK